MPNSLVALYRKNLATQGLTDSRDDLLITQEFGQMAQQEAPELFTQYPDFGEEYGQIRDVNAPSLPGEFGRAFKSGVKGLASTGVGGVALLTGSDWLRQKAADLDTASQEDAPTIPTLEDIAPGRTGVSKVLSRDALRYGLAKLGQVAPSIAEAGATALAGAAVGSAVAPGPGTVAGAAEGLVARGLIRSAIRQLVRGGVAEELVGRGLLKEGSEVALEQALKGGSKEVADIVSRQAISIGAKRGLTAANLANSYLLNAGDVYSEGADRPTSMALGLVSAVPDSALPSMLLGRLFPGVVASKAKELGRVYLADRAKKLLEAAGAVAVEGSTEYFQEGVNVVARNIKEGKDPLTFTDADLRRFREAGIAGAFGGALAAPSLLMEPHAQEATGTPPAPGEPTAPAPTAPVAPIAPVAPAPAGPTTTDVVRNVTTLSPQEKLARLAELTANPNRTPQEEQQFQVLQATVRQPAAAPSAPVAMTEQPAAPVAEPTPIPEAVPAPAAVEPIPVSRETAPVTPAEPMAPASAPVAETAEAFVLPSQLAGAKPRYGYRDKQFTLTFANDLDKALYILAQKTPSKNDAAYLDTVLKQTGMTEEQARAAGAEVRDAIKGLAKDAPVGELTVDQVFEMKPAAAATEAAAAQHPELTDLLQRYDQQEEIITPEDVAKSVDELLQSGDAPESLRAPLQEYQRLREEDFRELAGRGDMEGAGDDFIAAVRAAAGAPVASAEVVEATPSGTVTVDVSPITQAPTENEMHTIGGRMMREATSREDMAAVQKAMQEWTAPTQEQRVKQALTTGPKSIQELAEQLDIINHNIRRILGVGAKTGKFERIARGVYAMKNPNGSYIYVESTDSVKALPELARRGVKADFIFLDPPYKTAAIAGGNRGVKNYLLITPDQFNTIVEASKMMARGPDTPIYYMHSKAPSGLKEMNRYTDAFSRNGLKLVAQGNWNKTFNDGKPVTNVRGQPAQPEGIALFNQSGVLPKDALPTLDFTMVRPPVSGKGGRQSQKPVELYSKLLGFHSDAVAPEKRPNFVSVDSFAGTGGLAEASQRAGVSNISLEMDEDVIQKFIGPRLEAGVVNAPAAVAPVEGIEVPTKDGYKLVKVFDTKEEAQAAMRPGKNYRLGKSADGKTELWFKPKGRRISVGSPPGAEGDILNYIEEQGGITTRSSAKNPGGEYDGQAEAFRGVAKLLLSKGRLAPDELAQYAHDDGIIPGPSPDDLYRAVDAAVKNRAKLATQFKSEQHVARFEQAFLGNENPRKWLRAGKPISIDDLNGGDSFEVNGEKFIVKHIDEDGNVTIEDGISRTVPPGTLVYPDKGKVRRVKRGSFFPADEAPAAPAAAPGYQYTVQRQQTADGKVIPGYIQIDNIVNGQSTESTTIEKLRAQGVDLPDVPEWLPQGQYSLRQIQEAITRGPVPGGPKIEVTAAKTETTPFAHGKVVEGEPTMDFRTHTEYNALNPGQWSRAVGAVIDQGGIGSSTGNRADTRVALAMQAPDGRVVVTGIVRPQRILGVDGKALIKEPSLQRMAIVHGDQKTVEVGGMQPATVRDVVNAGYKPLAVLHFDAEPGKIHETFADQAAFDKAWALTEKSAGARLAETKPVAQALNESQIDDRLEALVREHGDNPPDAILHQMLDLIRQRDELSLRNQDQTGDTTDLPARTERAQSDHRAAVAASRTTEFNAVAMRMRNLGMRVDQMTQEFLTQGVKQSLQQRLDAIMGQIQQAPDAPARDELQRRADILQERLAATEQAGGVAYAPWHVGVAMDDVLNANTTNLVRLLHEASESLGMRLPTEMRGRMTRAIEQTMVELHGQTEAAATQTGVPVSRTVNPLDVLSEHLAQKLTAEGVPDAPSLAASITRWVKELYYRVAMAAQAAFGIEPSPELALGWFENQLRREVFGDFDYRLSRIIDRFSPETSLQRVAKLQTMEGTPGAMVDFVDPITRQMKQPGSTLDDRDALNWNLQLREEVPGHEPELDIPDPEARARIMGASLNDRLEFYTQLKQEIDPENKMPFESFWLELGRLGKNGDPRLMLGELAQRMKGAETAKIGGERMTKTMNDLAGLDARAFMRKVSATLANRHAQAIEAIDEASARLVDVAQEANKLEGDPRNAALHEDTLRKKARAMVKDMVNAYDRGLDTAHTHGELADAIRTTEGLMESDPIPENYQRVLKSLHDGTIPVFDYMRAIAELDLPLTDLSVPEILGAIRENGEQNGTLTQLAENRPLAVALATLAHDNATEVDQIQLGWLRDTSKYREIHAQLEEIRSAGQDKLKAMYKLLEEHRKAVGLAERVKLRYLEKRREIQRTSERIARMEERRQLIEQATPAVTAKLDALEQAHGGHYSEWTPADGKEYIAMRSQPDGSFRKSTRVLKFNRDGSAVDSDQVRSDIAHNREWLDVNAKLSGRKIYEAIKRQTYELANLDVQRQYAAGWNWGMLGWFDKFVRTPGDWARTLGHSAGQRVSQQINRFQFILRNFGEELKPGSYRWESARANLMRESGIKDIGDFRARIYDPVSYELNVNPGLDEGAAIRLAQRVARRRLPGPAGEGFNAAVAEMVRATKEQSTALDRVGRQYGIYVRDPRLGNELRDSVGRGWMTSPRMLRSQVVSTVMSEMDKAGWKLDYRTETDAKGQPVRKGIKAVTFAAIDPDNARVPQGSTPEQARTIVDQYFARLGDQNSLRTVFNQLFTPGIVSRWLEPFINKAGSEVFYHEKRPIPQADVHDAWVAAKGDVLDWIDRLGQSLQLDTDDDGHDPVALFRLNMMRQLDRLYGMESRLAYQHSQTRDVFDPMGPRRHLMMDSRVNDMIPPEHLEFATFDPEMTHKILGAVAFHSAFGRNGEAMITNLKELRDVVGPEKAAYDSLRGTTRGARVAEAKALGFDYKELVAANRRYADVIQLQGNLRSIFGVDNPAGPFYDLQGAFALLGGMAGQITDNPKTAAYNLIANTMRPFAMHSLGPSTISSTVRGYGNFLYQAVGSFLENFGVHILRSSQYAKDIGSVHGALFRNLPWGVIYSDQGSKGRLEDSKFIKPLKRVRATQEKGVQLGFGEAREFSRLAPVPGLGVLNTIADMAARAFGEAHIRQFEDMITRGVAYFKAHPEASADPSFRFTYGQLGMMKLDAGVLDYFRNRSVEYNMGTIEDVVRGAIKRIATGERVLTRDQAINVSMMYANEMDGHASLNTTPAILQTNPLFRAMLPLLRWPLWMMHATHQGLSTLEGRQSFKAMAKGLGTLALWNLPAGIAFSLMIDWYDDKLLGKKANTLPVDTTAAIPLVGPILAMAAGNLSPQDNALAMLTRSARAGNIYGLGWDVAAQVFGSYDPSTGVRQFSLDQRVLAMSQFLNFQQALSNVMHQGDATWSSVWRPLMSSMGGNGALHALDLANNAFGLDNAESRLVMRINASNWLRSAGREVGIETRGGNVAAQPGPLGMWTREMQLAAMAGDRASFLESYRKALNTARDTVVEDPNVPATDREREATNRVLASWRSRNPLEVFRARPTDYQMAQLYAVMSDDGQADVRDALNRYQTFTAMIAPSKQERAFNQSMQSQLRQFNPEALRRRLSPTLSLTSQ